MILDEIKASKKYALNGGPFGSKLVTNDYVPEGVPVIRGSNLSKDTYFSFEDLVFVSEDKADELRPNNAHPGDIIFTQRGTLGQVGIIPKESKYDRFVISQSQMKLTVDEAKADPYYVYYYFKNLDTIQRIKNLAFSSGVPHINLQVLREFEIELPSLPTQRKIAAILSAYDDLIENNTRRIKILEEMAQALYREWFVHFRFPGHEKVRMVDSPLGRIPEGWEVKRIGDVIETVGGGTPSTKNPEFWENGEVTWFTPSDLTSNNSLFINESSKKISKIGLQRSSARIFPAYSVMMTSRATIGITAINTREACTNQGFITCIPNKRLSAFQIFYWILQNKDKIINIASGATYKEINRTEFRDLLITLSNVHIANKFVELMTPMMKEIENLIRKNFNLCCTRDLLLPKLISGDLKVENLEIKLKT